MVNNFANLIECRNWIGNEWLYYHRCVSEILILIMGGGSVMIKLFCNSCVCKSKYMR